MHPCMHPGHRQQWFGPGRVVFSHPSLATSEPPLSEGAAHRLEAVFLYGSHTFVHDGPLPMLCPFGHIPPMRRQTIINGVVVHGHLHP